MKPRTKTGWWAIGLMGMFAVMYAVNITVLVPGFEPLPIPRFLLISYGLFMILCGLGSAIPSPARKFTAFGLQIFPPSTFPAGYSP